MIDLDDMRRYTVVDNPEGDASYEEALWDILRSFSEEEKSKFLQFVTGNGKAPLDGFSYLKPHVWRKVVDEL